MRTIEEVDADIAEVKRALADLHGEPTEVYARIVGYYRSVRAWNAGKKAEYGHRVVFEVKPSIQSVAEHIVEYCKGDADFLAKMLEAAKDDDEASALLTA